MATGATVRTSIAGKPGSFGTMKKVRAVLRVVAVIVPAFFAAVAGVKAE